MKTKKIFHSFAYARLQVFLSMIFGSVFAYGGNLPDSVIRHLCDSIGLPIVYVLTVDSVMPTYERVEAPAGCDGVGITNNEKVPGRMWIVQAGDTIYDSGEYLKDSAGMTIKVRGNTSAASTTPKKPYKIKLQRKDDFLFRGNDSVYADKEWVLLRCNLDYTFVGNMVNTYMNMPWTPASEFVFLFLNGDFRGVYLLSECVKRNKQCRIDISKTGFLFEFDAYWWNEDYYINSSIYKYNYTLKYPEAKDILPWQEEYLTNCISRVETAYRTSGAIDSVIDITSYARWLWIHDMLGNRDAGGSNMFLYKYDTLTTSKVTMACCWDFDGCFTTNLSRGWSNNHSIFWNQDFFSLPQLSFIGEYISMYDNLVVATYDSVIAKLEDMRSSEFMSQVDAAFVLENSETGRHDGLTYARLNAMITYLRNRKVLIADLMDQMKDTWGPIIEQNSPTGMVENKKSENVIVTNEYYDVLGRSHGGQRGGLVIWKDSANRWHKSIICR